MFPMRSVAFSFGGFPPLPSCPKTSRHQPLRPDQRPSCRSRLFPARTSELEAVRCPLTSAFGKAGGAIVDINVGQFMVTRNRELNRGRSVLQPVTNGKALVINAVVAVVKELLAAAQDVQLRRASGTHTGGTEGRRLTPDSSPITWSTASTRSIARPRLLPCASVILAFSSAWVTASNVVRMDSRALS